MNALRWRSLVWLGAVIGCGATAPQRAPGQPPTPATISKAEPGGDAHDPHEAALKRQLEQPWGQRPDKDDQLLFPMPDEEHWKRIRFWGVDHFVGFRYGKSAHVVIAGLVQDVEPGERLDSERCLRRFDKWARPQLRAYNVKLGPVLHRSGTWRDQPIVIQTVDGQVDWAFSRKRFTAAWAAYPAYPTACLIYAVGAQWGEHPELAKQVIERWIREGFAQIMPLTQDRPYRK